MSGPKSTQRVPGRGWAYCSVVTGALVSIAANVAHSYVPPTSAPAWWPAGTAWDPKAWHPKLGAVIFAVLWPVALALGTEVLTRIPWPKRWGWNVLRFGGVLPVAAVAGIVSYKHLSALLGFYGEDYLTAHIGPFAIDGLMVVATGALMATAGHGAGSRPAVAGHADAAADTIPAAPDTAPVPVPQATPAARLAPSVADMAPDTPDTAVPGPDTASDMEGSAGPVVGGWLDAATADMVAAVPDTVPDTADRQADRQADTVPDMTGHPVSAPDTAPVPTPGNGLLVYPEIFVPDTVPDTPDMADEVPDTDTATAVAWVRQRYPSWSSVQIGEYLGVSDRTVRRHLAASASGGGA